MKTQTIVTSIAIFAFSLLLTFAPTSAADASDPMRYEYATLRWAGRDNTHLIRPDGTTEILGNQLKAARKPDRVDERSFYMNLALNALAREGYELAAMTSDDYILKRQVRK